MMSTSIEVTTYTSLRKLPLTSYNLTQNVTRTDRPYLLHNWTDDDASRFSQSLLPFPFTESIPPVDKKRKTLTFWKHRQQRSSLRKKTITKKKWRHNFRNDLAKKFMKRRSATTMIEKSICMFKHRSSRGSDSRVFSWQRCEFRKCCFYSLRHFLPLPFLWGGWV